MLNREFSKHRNVPPTEVELYRVGDTLLVTASMFQGRSAGPCKVLAIVPRELRGPIRYRIQSASEECQRVVSEADLNMLSH